MLTRVGLALIRVDSCWTRVDSCRTGVDSCLLVLIHVDLCWHSCIRIDLIEPNKRLAVQSQQLEKSLKYVYS